MKYILPFLLLVVYTSCGNDNETIPPVAFELKTISVGDAQNQSEFTGVDPASSVLLELTDEADESTVKGGISLKKNESEAGFTYELSAGNRIRITPVPAFESFSTYKFVVNPSLKSKSGVALSAGKVCILQVGMDQRDKFERIPDEDLLTLVQRQTFRYFWEFGHEVSGMARERSTSENTVTTGGTGFGVMAMLVAAERGFITREEVLERISRITAFLDTKCTAYHGAFPHWVDGATGETLPFSTKDDGADLVETALLFQGLLAARAYFDRANAQETGLRAAITRMWEAVEWTWFRQNGQQKLFWHWSPTVGWAMDMPVSGWNESLIVYVLAASSPTYPISKEVYDEGWARNGGMRNGNSYYGYKLPLGTEKGGPLFLSQYSFLGICPKDLRDAYADYWEQNRNHSLIHYNYCLENPKKFAGYGEDCWGLTACDGNEGYSAYSPTNDKGVIAPTAALSAFPYTPEESMKALHFYYYKLGDKLWRDYGFADAFNLSARWYDNQHIAIDQGPIVVMIENYRSGLLWKLFMSVPEVKTGMKSLGFESPLLN